MFTRQPAFAAHGLAIFDVEELPSTDFLEYTVDRNPYKHGGYEHPHRAA